MNKANVSMYFDLKVSYRILLWPGRVGGGSVY